MFHVKSQFVPYEGILRPSSLIRAPMHVLDEILQLDEATIAHCAGRLKPGRRCPGCSQFDPVAESLSVILVTIGPNKPDTSGAFSFITLS